MQKAFSFVFDIGNVLCSYERYRDERGIDRLAFAPIHEGIALLQECHAFSLKHTTQVLACTNFKKHEVALLNDLFPALFARFSGIVSSDVASAKKPDPAIFHYLLSSYELIPHMTFFFDDDLRNVESARQVGLIGIHVTSIDQVRKELGRYIPDFKQ